MNKEMLRPSDIATILNVTSGRVYQLIRSGCVPSVRVGGRICIPRAAWESFIKTQSDKALSNVKGNTHANAA